MANVTVQSRINPELKQQAEVVFSSMGMSTSDAIRVFLQQSVNVGGLPFQPMAKLPNKETIEAMEELASGNGSSASSSEEFYKDLGI